VSLFTKTKDAMKKLILILIILILSACLILWVKGNAMREIQTEIEIGAPPEKVWSILVNIENWNKWNPIINQASGVVSVGSELTITMRGEGGKDGPKYMPIVTSLQEPKLFVWRAKMISDILFANGRVSELEKTVTGTRLINKETFRGMLMPLFWGKLSSHVPSMLNEMNDALKKQVEEGSG